MITCGDLKVRLNSVALCSMQALGMMSYINNTIVLDIIYNDLFMFSIYYGQSILGCVFLSKPAKCVIITCTFCYLR